MKKFITYITVAIFAAAAFSGCDDFLNEEMTNDYNSQTFYRSEANALRAVNGAYNAIMFHSANNYIWIFGDVASDDSQKGGASGDLADADAIDDFTATADNGILNNYWAFVYEGISRANNVIAHVPSIDMNAATRSRIVGEAKFIRAYSYFNLVNIWGEVPLRLEPVSPANANIPVSSVAVIYARIEQDLLDAIAAPLPASYSDADAGRVTLGAAYALLAKAYLYQGKWGDCLTAIANLDALQLYDLEPEYADLFRSGGEASVETIFAIRHLNDQNPGLGNILNVYFAPSSENGYFFNAPNPGFAAAFTELTTGGETDPRLDATIGRPGQDWINGNTFDASWSPTGYLVKKHQQPLAEVPIGRKSDSFMPYIYLRYGDILLMKAEALAERNLGDDLEDALDALDLVRGRAGLAPSTATTQAAVRTAVRAERRRELGFEFHRFFDLMRWGEEAAKEALGSDFPWDGGRFYFPIPQGERDANQSIN